MFETAPFCSQSKFPRFQLPIEPHESNTSLKNDRANTDFHSIQDATKQSYCKRAIPYSSATAQYLSERY